MGQAGTHECDLELDEDGLKFTLQELQIWPYAHSQKHER